jgi:hypothetical protein
MKIRKKYEINNIKEVSIRDLIDLGSNIETEYYSIENRLVALEKENFHLKNILAQLIERLHLGDECVLKITECNHSYELADNDDIEEY